MGDIRAQLRSQDRMLRNQRGQATLEYILLLTLTVTAAGALSRGILTGIYSGVTTLGAQLEKDLKTGRADVRTWKN